ncbi:MAG: hypothetical protein MUQ10_18050, partial [Anaerolineae bacterium]|nr:hypothetical protein [Anaerolineae bacterium]
RQPAMGFDLITRQKALDMIWSCTCNTIRTGTGAAGGVTCSLRPSRLAPRAERLIRRGAIGLLLRGLFS